MTARVSGCRRHERTLVRSLNTQIAALESMRRAAVEIRTFGFITTTTHAKLQSSTAQLVGKAVS